MDPPGVDKGGMQVGMYVDRYIAVTCVKYRGCDQTLLPVNPPQIPANMIKDTAREQGDVTYIYICQTSISQMHDTSTWQIQAQ